MTRLTALLLTALACALAAAPSASADFGIHDLDVTFTDQAGATQALAGSHPYEMTTSFKANLSVIEGKDFPEDAIKDVEIFQVPGFVGDLTAAPTCATLDFLTRAALNATGCSDSTAIGKVLIEFAQGGTPPGPAAEAAPLYNLEPAPGSAARLGFFVQGVPVTISAAPTEEFPNNILASSRNISQVLEFYGAGVTLWGVPADPAHDEERGLCYQGGKSCPAGIAPRPFLTLPRSCEGPLATVAELDSWQDPGPYLPNGNPDFEDPRWVEEIALTHDDASPPNPQGMSGCGGVGFGPTTEADPSTSSAESASGLTFTIEVKDEGLKDKDGRAQADIEAIQLLLPEGITANPSAAEGLGVCSAQQFAAEELQTPPGAGCPGASKLGTIEALTPILGERILRGSLYLASPDDNPFGSLIALYLVVRDPGIGAFVKLAGEVEPDPATGQLITTIEDLPPFPLSRVITTMRSGPRAPLVTPPACDANPSTPQRDPYTTLALLYPSSGAEPLESTSSFEITSGPGGAPCPPAALPFDPGFEAGSENNAAGAYSPFAMRLTRRDGDQDITRFSATLPKGVVGRIAGLGRCGEEAIAAAKAKSGRQELAAPSCPASSQVGRVLTGAGVGNSLTYVPGSLYLAGPYNGAPLSVVAIVPAVAGPFDVGTVITRVALNLNYSTAEVEVDGSRSDPIPHILRGLPLKVRDIRVYTDRLEFTLNPTSCAEKETRAQIFGGGNNPFSSADDSPLAESSRYQAASCASLKFKPKLALKLKGGTRRSDHPALSATLTYPQGPGYANVRDATTTLPPTLFIDNAHINNPCTRVQFNANACPPSSVLGSAKAITPLLDQPLEGPVYFRSNGGERNLPDVVADLHGLFHIVLVGFVDSKNARIRTRFLGVPDAPVSRFELKLFGGKRGLLVNSANLCAKKQRAKLSLVGQNGRRQDSEPVVRTGCGGRKPEGVS